MQSISSKENELIKHIKKLKDKKERDISNEYVIEGIKLIQEAIQENVNIKQIIVCDDCDKTESMPKDLMYEIAKYDCIYVTKKIFKYISEVQEPQGILAVIEKNNLDREIDYSQDIIVALDDVQDPGNPKGTADSYNPKVVRSTMGAIFRIKIIEFEDLEKTLKEIKKHKFKVVVTSLQTENSIYEINYNKKVIVIGNEAKGVEKDIQELADEKIKIPMLGKTESLNASVATGIVLYEYVRQKWNSGDSH